MKKIQLVKSILYPLLIWLALFCLLQVLFPYNFYTLEESSLFLFDTSWLSNNLNRAGGFSLLISKYLIQFFAYPYFGALITAVLLTTISLQIKSILKRLTGNAYYFLYLLPVIPLLLIQQDMHYRLQGTTSLMLMLAAFQGFLFFHKLRGRLLYSVIAVPCLFYLAGSVSILFAVCVLLWQCLSQPRKCYWFLLPFAEAILVAMGSIYLSMVGEFRFAFLPDMYYQPLLTNIPVMLYYTWLVIPVALLLGWLVSKRKEMSWKRSFIENAVQLVLISAIFYISIGKCGDLRSAKFREINYYTRAGNWDKVIELCRGKINNLLYLMDLNIALANKGILADTMFQFEQKGEVGLYPTWNNDYSIAVILSDFNFTIGNTAGALHYAFEGNVASNNESPRMISRLIQSHLIYGNYPVAERYIRTLEKTHVYKNQAKSLRKFLYNDEAVNSDPVLGVKRRLILDHNFLYNTEGYAYICSEIARRGAEAKAALHYLGAMYLLNKDIQRFEYLLQQFYGTDVLPELPVSFQEAILILHEAQPEMWTKYRLTSQVLERFKAYRKDFVAARTNPALRTAMERNYKGTYWYYFMFK